MTKIKLPNISIVLVGGRTGSGKTHTSKQIAKRYFISYIDKDSINDAFSLSRKDISYNNTASHVHDVMLGITADNVSVQNSVLLDAPFASQVSDEGWIERVHAIESRYECVVKMVWCTAKDETRVKRMLLRDHPRDRERVDENGNIDVKLSDIPCIPFEHIIFDTENDSISEVFKFLET